MSKQNSKNKYDIAFNVVVKYGFCGDCSWGLDSKYCHECDCYDQVKLLREAVEHMKEPKPAYRGYTATVEYDEDDKLWHGKLDNTKNLVDFFAEKEADVETEFHKAVDDYISFFEAIGKKPQEVSQPYDFK